MFKIQYGQIYSADAGSGSIAFPCLKSNMDRFIDDNDGYYRSF